MKKLPPFFLLIILSVHSANMGQAGSSPQERLLSGIYADDPVRIRAAHAAGADLDVRSRHGYPPLAHAVLGRKPAAFAALLALGARPDSRDKHDMTALMHAAALGDTGMVRALLDHRADHALTGGSEGLDALVHAVIKGHRETVALLLERGADPFRMNRHGGWSCTTARHYGHHDIIALIRARTDKRHYAGWIRVYPLAGRDGKDYWIQSYFDHNPATCFPDTLTAPLFARVLAGAASEKRQAGVRRVYPHDPRSGVYRRAAAIHFLDHEYTRDAFAAAGLPLDLFLPAANRDWSGAPRSYDGHIGIDHCVWYMEEIDGPIPVYAVADGVVLEVVDGNPDHNEPGSNNHILVNHGYGRISYYAHLRKGIPVRVGERVRAGQQIALLGSSGGSGPHLHFGIKEWDEWVDPYTGPGNPGVSRFREQPPHSWGLPVSLVHYGLRDVSLPQRPFVHPPRLAFHRYGERNRAFWLQLWRPQAGMRLEARVLAADGREHWRYDETVKAGSDHLTVRWFTFDWIKPAPGEWVMQVTVDGRCLLEAPFTVIGAAAPRPPNRPPRAPHAPSLRLLPGTAGVYHCLVTVPVRAPDPDFDQVRYRYVWRVRERVVRDVTVAAHGDYCPAPAGHVSCTVSVFDGVAHGPEVRVEHSGAGAGSP